MTLPVNNFKALILDMDGVIVDTIELHYQSWRRLAAEEGLPFSRAINDRLRGLSRRDSLAILYESHKWPEKAAVELLLKRKNKYFLELAEKITPADLLPGIDRLIKEAKRNGLKLAVASSSRNVAFILEHLQITGLFDAIVDGQSVEQAKPDPALFLLAAARLEVAPRQCIVVEDAVAGIQAGRKAGMLVIGVGPKILMQSADYTFGSAKKLKLPALLKAHHIRRILVIRRGGIGDIIFTLPAVGLLRADFPEAEISFLVKRKFAPLLKGFPAVNRIIALDSGIKSLWEIFSLFCKLRRGRFDLTVDLHGHGKTAFLAWLTGAPRRLGIIRHKASGFFYTAKLPLTGDCHIIELNLRLLQTAGLAERHPENHFQIPAAAREEAKDLISRLGCFPGRPLVVIQPLTNFARKNYPLAGYQKLAESLADLGLQVIFGGGPADREALEAVIHDFPITAGRTDLLTGAAVMDQAQLIVGGDTGFLHLATALGKRVLMLMEPSESAIFHPYQHPEWALVSPTYKKIDDLTPESVITTAKKALDEMGVKYGV